MDEYSIQLLNPWWSHPEAIREDLHLKQILGKSYYLDNPVKAEVELIAGKTFLLRGARQVGKTTLLKEMVLKAISSKAISHVHCLFLSCEAFGGFKELQEFLAHWLSTRKGAPVLVCLDEITFVEEWQRAVLWILNAGLLQNATTLITGSNARDLKKMSERFPGRNVKEISVYPFSLRDYRQLPCFQPLSDSELLSTYLRVGGFPHALRDYCEYGAVTDETYETYANWIFGDAHRFQLTQELLTHILFRIFDTLASQVTWQRLIEKSPVKSHETAAAYTEHLALSFLCQVLNCYDTDKEMASPRRAKKIYFTDPLLYALAGGYLRGMRNVYAWWLAQLSTPDYEGKIFESVVVNHFSRSHPTVYYWYSAGLKREVDLLVKQGDRLDLFDVKLQSQNVRPALGREVRVITPKGFAGGWIRTNSTNSSG